MNAANLQPESLLVAIAWILGAYLVGSIPEAWLLAKWLTGQDLRTLGSGNIGVMNTALSVTRWAGLVVFLSEIAKGLLVVWAPRQMGAGEGVIDLCLVAVVTGVRWPIWLGFKGGRANTCGMAAILAISYTTAAAIVFFWVLARLLIDSSFKSARLTMLAMPLIAGLVTRSWLFSGAVLVISWIYLTAQQPGSDDHAYIKEHWRSLYRFLVSPPRRGGRIR